MHSPQPEACPHFITTPVVPAFTHLQHLVCGLSSHGLELTCGKEQAWWGCEKEQVRWGKEQVRWGDEKKPRCGGEAGRQQREVREGSGLVGVEGSKGREGADTRVR